MLWDGIYDAWTRRWQADNSCRMTKIFYPTPHIGKSKVLLNLTRTKSRRLIEIVTGQNDLNYIQNKTFNRELLCRFCEEEEETFDHLALDCPCFYQQRQQIFGNLNWKGTHLWRIDKMIQFSRIKSIDNALNMHDSESDDSWDSSL